VEAATLPQDAPVAEDAPKPARKRKAAQDASAAAPASPNDIPVAKPKDTYPDELIGTFRIHGVVRREGRAHAIDATGEFGRLWIATTVNEYARLCEQATDADLTLDVARVGNAMTIMRVLRSKPAEEATHV
jgi:hypothetical protein